MRILTNKPWLKITGLTVLILGAVILVYTFWPTKIQKWKEDKSDWEDQPLAQQTGAEKLYQAALFYKKREDSLNTDYRYRKVVNCCRQILEHYPQTLQAEKARELLQQVPVEYRGRYDEEVSRRHVSQPKVKKSRPLRRRR